MSESAGKRKTSRSTKKAPKVARRVSARVKKRTQKSRDEDHSEEILKPAGFKAGFKERNRLTRPSGFKAYLKQTLKDNIAKKNPRGYYQTIYGDNYFLIVVKTDQNVMPYVVSKKSTLSSFMTRIYMYNPIKIAIFMKEWIFITKNELENTLDDIFHGGGDEKLYMYIRN